MSQEVLLNITAIAELEKHERKKIYLIGSQEDLAAFREIIFSGFGSTERMQKTGEGLVRTTKMIRDLKDYEDRLEDLY